MAHYPTSVREIVPHAKEKRIIGHFKENKIPNNDEPTGIAELDCDNPPTISQVTELASLKLPSHSRSSSESFSSSPHSDGNASETPERLKTSGGKAEEEVEGGDYEKDDGRGGAEQKAGTGRNETTSGLETRTGDDSFLSPPAPPKLEEPMANYAFNIKWELMRQERYRLSTFCFYPRESTVSSIQLASRGFVYLPGEITSIIICFFCKTSITALDDLDKIDLYHESTSPRCPMVSGENNHDNDNITIEQQYSNAIASQNAEHQQTSLAMAVESAAPPSNSNQTEHTNASNHLRCSQPSDERAPSVFVTNTSDFTDENRASNSGSSADNHDNNNDNNDNNNDNIEDTSSRPARPNAEISRTDYQSATVIQNNSVDVNNGTTQLPTTNNATAQPNTATEHSNQNENNTTEQNDDTPSQSDDNSQQNSQEPSGTSTSDSVENASRQTPSFEKLQIITARAKRIEYGVLAVRLESYKEWPKQHHMKPIDLAKAGYFFTGYSDCTRCFFCGGGLRNWEKGDDVWVEHARWFPKCAFLLQEVGTGFIQTVQEMANETEQISFADVQKRMAVSGVPSLIDYKQRAIESDAAVLALIDSGFDNAKVIELAQEIRKAGDLLSTEILLEGVKERKIPRQVSRRNYNDMTRGESVSVRRGGDEKKDKEMMKALQKENTEFREQFVCKVCMDAEVTVVFLPCGHMVSCTECAHALSSCPVCRMGIKGIVRAYI